MRLIRDGEKVGEGGMEVGGEGDYIPIATDTVTTRMTCIKMGSDESHFNVSVGSDGQSHKAVYTNHNLSEEKGEPKRYRTEVLPLTSLTPYRWAKPAGDRWCDVLGFVPAGSVSSSSTFQIFREASHFWGLLSHYYHQPNLSKGANSVSGQRHGDKVASVLKPSIATETRR